VKTGTKLGILALVLAVMCAAVWSYHIRQVDIPENRTAFVVVFLAAWALGAAAFVKGTAWYGGVAAGFALFISTLLPFTIAISSQETSARAIQVGDTIPRFTAVDDSGGLFYSDSLHGHIVLIKFFRAHW
jgi:hypothetical protein